MQAPRAGSQVPRREQVTVGLPTKPGAHTPAHTSPACRPVQALGQSPLGSMPGVRRQTACMVGSRLMRMWVVQPRSGFECLL